jgi:predicted DCC family thiol-disulfide oxidoreductase YuxK
VIRVHTHSQARASARIRLPNTAHTSRPWRIHELTHDFRVEDVWALPTTGGPNDFPRLVKLMSSGDPSRGAARTARALWAIRWTLGKLLGWDDPNAGLGSKAPTLRDRLPADLRDTPSGPDFDALPFTSLYLLDDEWAAEIINKTMHGVLHVGWVPDGQGRYRGQLAVLVKPNGLVGRAYMASIRPFRYLIVYPAILRNLERQWRARDAHTAEGPPRVAKERGWTVLYDADCGFCNWLLSALLRWDRAGHLHPIALQRAEADNLLKELAPAERMASWHLISPSGERYSGGAALPPLLRLLPAGQIPATAIARFPSPADRGYRWVAEHRSQLSRCVPASIKQRARQRVHKRD